MKSFKLKEFFIVSTMRALTKQEKSSCIFKDTKIYFDNQEVILPINKKYKFVFVDYPMSFVPQNKEKDVIKSTDKSKKGVLNPVKKILDGRPVISFDGFLKRHILFSSGEKLTRTQKRQITFDNNGKMYFHDIPVQFPFSIEYVRPETNPNHFSFFSSKIAPRIDENNIDEAVYQDFLASLRNEFK